MYVNYLLIKSIVSKINSIALCVQSRYKYCLYLVRIRVVCIIVELS